MASAEDGSELIDTSPCVCEHARRHPPRRSAQSTTGEIRHVMRATYRFADGLTRNLGPQFVALEKIEWLVEGGPVANPAAFELETRPGPSPAASHTRNRVRLGGRRGSCGLVAHSIEFSVRRRGDDLFAAHLERKVDGRGEIVCRNERCLAREG